jgi:outer membrane lipoprotein-sorting protein
MTMKPLILSFVLALTAAPGLAAPGEPPLDDLKTIEVAPERGGVTLADVEKFLNGIKTLSAAFVQTAPDGTVSHGRLYLERPGKARFEYSDGTPVLIVADGTILNFIDYEVGQVTRWPIADTALAPLVSDAVAFGKNVEIASIGPGGVAGLTAVSAFDPAKPEQGTLTLIFSGSEASGLTLLAWEVTDAQGGLTRIQLESYTLNAPLEARLWTYDDPRGERFQRKRTR